jgi:hypothetical protein
MSTVSAARFIRRSIFNMIHVVRFKARDGKTNHVKHFADKTDAKKYCNMCNMIINIDDTYKYGKYIAEPEIVTRLKHYIYFIAYSGKRVVFRKYYGTRKKALQAIDKLHHIGSYIDANGIKRKDPEHTYGDYNGIYGKYHYDIEYTKINQKVE